jgi:hypothetical protein
VKSDASFVFPHITHLCDKGDVMLFKVVLKLFGLKIKHILFDDFHVFRKDDFLAHLAFASLIVQLINNVRLLLFPRLSKRRKHT